MPIAADAPAPSGDPQVAAERAGRDAGPRRDFALKYRNWRVIRELAPRGLYMRRQSLIGLLTLALFLSAAQVFTLDGVTGLIAPVLFRTDTRYAAGYADSAFRRVRKGMEDKDVRATLGDPLEEVWDYSRDGVDCGLIFITGSSVTAVSTAHKCGLAPVNPGMSTLEVINKRGAVTRQIWLYSTSPSGASYRERIIYLENGIVSRKESSFYID